MLRQAIAGQAVGKLLSAVLGLAATTVLVRYLDQADYGRLSAGLAFGALFASLNDPGLSQVVLRRASRRGAEIDRLVQRSLGLSLVVSTIGALVAAAAALVVFRSAPPVVLAAALCSCAAITLAAPAAALLPVFQSEMRMWPVALGEILTRAVALGLLAAVVAADGDAVLVAAAITGAQATNLLVLGAAAGRGRRRPVIDLATWRSLAREAAPVGLALGVYGVYVKVDLVLLERLGTPSDLADYALSYRVVDLVGGLLVAVMVTVVGPLSRAAAEHEAAFSRRMVRLRESLIRAGSLTTIGGAVLAPVVLLLLAGSNTYASAAAPLTVLLAATAFSGLQSVYNTGLVLVGRADRLLPLTVALLLTNVLANLVVIPRYGAVGAATVTLVTEVLSVVVAGRWLRAAVPLAPITLLSWGAMLLAMLCVPLALFLA